MLSDEQVSENAAAPLHGPLTPAQERAWYDSHRASLVPEPDAGTVLEEVRAGKVQSRLRDRGLTVRHLVKFFDATNWSGFDDTDTVSALARHSVHVAHPRV